MLDTILESLKSSAVLLLALCAFGGLVILVGIMKSRIHKMLSKHVIVDEIKIGQRIMELLIEVRITCAADRVAVYMFHNGERYTNGNSILRVSSAYETVAAGIAKQRTGSQNVLISSVAEAVEFLTAENANIEVCYTRTEDIIPCHYKATLQSQGVKATAKFPLHKGEDVIGFVCADFVVKEPDIIKLSAIPKLAARLELYVNNTTKKSAWYKLLGGK